MAVDRDRSKPRADAVTRPRWWPGAERSKTINGNHEVRTEEEKLPCFGSDSTVEPWQRNPGYIHLVLGIYAASRNEAGGNEQPEMPPLAAAIASADSGSLSAVLIWKQIAARSAALGPAATAKRVSDSTIIASGWAFSQR